MPNTLNQTQISQQSTWIEIRLDRLLENLYEMKSKQPSYTKVMAVVKANAYGHGLREIANTLAPHVNYLGVSSVVEALDLRERNIAAPIFLFGRLLPSELPPVITAGITLCVSSLEEAVEISELSGALSKRTKIHIKVDTGMGRLGMHYDEALKTIKKIAVLKNIALEGIFTHFPTAEKDDHFADEQLRQFILLLDSLEKEGILFEFRHASNSSGILKLKSPALNMIRPGLSLYGIYPDPNLENAASLSAILSLKSRISFLKTIQPGESVGYGRSFIADHSLNIGILPIGYSHGYPFSCSNRSEVLYEGKRFKIAGRVSMDYLAVNFENYAPRVGDEVVLIGESGCEKIRAEEMAI